MSSESNTEQQEFELSLAVFAVSAGLVGACLTGIGLLQVMHGLNRINTLGDEFLAVDAGLFLLTCMLAFFSFRARDARRRRWLRKVSDVTFLVGLGLLTAVSALITFAVLK